jgi:hypothetical protein
MKIDVHVKEGIVNGIQVNDIDHAVNEIVESWMHQMIGQYFEYESMKHITEKCIAECSKTDQQFLSLRVCPILQRL